MRLRAVASRCPLPVSNGLAPRDRIGRAAPGIKDCDVIYFDGRDLSQRMYDLLVVGGGINGVAIARDAAGRGLRGLLCEKGDLAAATSSASSKLVHGGLRYLEHGDFRLVRESLAEREVLLRMAPHLVRPMRFVLPQGRGSRPRWLGGPGGVLYDRLGGGRRAALGGTPALS